MRKRLMVAAVLLGLWASSGQAAPPLGAGIMVGEPSGGTLKLWVDRDEAWVFGLGVSTMNDPSIQGQVDYVLHIYEITQAVGLSKTPVYAGLGFRLNGPEDGSVEAGIRLPVGLARFFDRENVEIFAEVAPVLNLTPDFKGDINFAVGIRFYH